MKIEKIFQYLKDCDYQENGAEVNPYHNLVKSQSEIEVDF
jgi:hypothetical protein